MRRMLFFLVLVPLSFAQINENVTLRGGMSLAEMSINPSSGSDIWGFTDADGREYAIMTGTNGTIVIDISNPSTPVEIGAVSGNNSTWRDAKTYIYNNTSGAFSAYAFVTTEAVQGLQIIDLSAVPAGISLATTFNGISSAHNIFINPTSTNPYAYVVGSNQASGGVVVLDISDPLNPVNVGEWDQFYTHDFYLGTTWADPNFNGREIGMAFCGTNNLSIIDFTDKTNPTTIRNYTYPNLGYCHAGWVSEDGRYLFINDEFDERQLGQNTTVYVLDLLDMSNPTLVTTYMGPTTAVDHNSFVKDGYLHMSNYTRGYSLVDISDPTNPFEYGYYDTFPSNNDNSYNGAWGAFPYYESGLVAISDIQSGLIILEPNFSPSFWLQADQAVPTICEGSSVVVEIQVQANALFSAPVTLALGDLPPGINGDFSQNPISPNETASLTLNAAGAAAGLFQVRVTGTGAGAPDAELTLNLEVMTAADAAPLLESPVADACVGPEGLRLSWEALGAGRNYHLEVAEDALFQNVVAQADTDQNSHILNVVLELDRSYYWRVRSENACGLGAWSDGRSFFTAVQAILLVDDDDNSPDVAPFYTGLLDSLGWSYQVYDTEGGNGPSASFMANYQWVIWFAGDDDDGGAGPNATDEIALTTYLNNGGKLFLSAQDYYYDTGNLTPFMSGPLGLSSVGNDTGDYTTVSPTGPLAGLGTLNLAPAVGNEFFDQLNAGSGTPVFLGNNSRNGAVLTTNTLFVGFTFASAVANSPTEAEALLQYLYDDYGIEACEPVASACVLHDLHGDGFDLDDFRRRAAVWGGEETLLSLIDLLECLP